METNRAPETSRLVIEDGVHGRIPGRLQLAAAAFREETFQDSEDVTRRGLTASLHVTSRDPDGVRRRHWRVFPGAELVTAGFAIRVVEIGTKASGKPFVSVDVDAG